MSWEFCGTRVDVALAALVSATRGADRLRMPVNWRHLTLWAAYGLFPSVIVFSSIMMYRLAVDRGSSRSIKDCGWYADRRSGLKEMLSPSRWAPHIEARRGFGASRGVRRDAAGWLQPLTRTHRLLATRPGGVRFDRIP